MRKRAGLSQRQLAEKLDLTQPAIVEWEKRRAKPLMDKLPDIAKALGVSVEELMFEKKRAA